MCLAIMTLVRRRLRGVIERVYPAADLKVISGTSRLPTPPFKSPIPTLAQSNVVYLCSCACGAAYVGRTERHLSTRVSEHLPSWLSNPTGKIPTSSIARHILDTGHSITAQSFRVIARQRNSRVLRFAEAASIWKLQPNLCVQKEFSTQLALPW